MIVHTIIIFITFLVMFKPIQSPKLMLYLFNKSYIVCYSMKYEHCRI